MIRDGFIIVSLRLNSKLLAWNKDPSLIPFVKGESDLQNPNQDFCMPFPSRHSQTLQLECTTSLKYGFLVILLNASFGGLPTVDGRTPT